MLSKLRRFAVVDEEGRRGRLADLAVALLEGDYPPVTRLLFYNEQREPVSLAWDNVREIDWKAHRIKVGSLEQGEKLSSGKLRHEVLLQRDVLDALVLDLQNRRATRANDLQLKEEDGALRLRAADTSLGAIIRRMTRGRYAEAHGTSLYDWKYIEFLRGDPQAVRNGAGYHLRITRLPPGEIASLCNPLPYLHAAELITLLPDPKAVDTLEAMSPERQLQVFEELDEEQALRLLVIMAPDVAADIVGRLQTGTMRRYLEKLPKQQSERIIDLLRYAEDTVGGIMTNDVVYACCDLTVKQAREQLRERLKETEFVFLIY
ncbi:MAG: magnesium transporter, partial [Acidobacteria bacterium]|nr:magnesium transporter [Acidobacteriota bacterium]